ncbi:MAG: 3-hydroxyacyl-CoA dehydrogenase NAD-binding domain-containing protein, partial [Gemmatimonadales bacterium]
MSGSGPTALAGAAGSSRTPVESCAPRDALRVPSAYAAIDARFGIAPQAESDAKLDRSLAKQVERAQRSPAETAATLARVTVATELAELAGCDLVIESVVED